MVRALRPTLLGDHRGQPRHLTFVVGSFVVAFVGYATGAFEVGGGVVFVPVHAASVGAIVGAWIGYRAGALPIAWAAVYASYLGFHAEWAVFGLSGRLLADRIAFLVSPDGLAFFGVSALVLGTVAFAGGRVARFASTFIARRG